MLSLIFVTVNIRNVLLRLECRHGDVCATDQCHRKQEFVRPRWPYNMRPSARAEKYMCVIVIR